MATLMANPEIVKIANSHTSRDTRIFEKEAVTLAREGFKVSYIVPCAESFEFMGVQVISVKVPASGFDKLFITPLRIFRKAIKFSSRAVIHIHDSELLIVGTWLRLLGRRVVYDAHEDTVRQIAYQHWIPRFLKWPYAQFYFLLERFCGLLFNKIIVAEPIIARHYPPTKTVLVRNFPIVATYSSPPMPFNHRKDYLVYAGIITNERSIEQMISAVVEANERVQFRFLLIGKFAPSQLAEKLLPNPYVDYFPWMSLPDLIVQYQQSKAGIIIPQPNNRYTTNIPVKMLEFMAAGLPVIGSKFGVASNFVVEGNAGITVDPNNHSELVEAMVRIFENQQEAEQMGMRGHKLVHEKYNWESESIKLVELYREIFSKQ